jgi:hypothetical protein
VALSKDTFGLYENISFEEYAALDALNASTLKEFRKSPLHVQTAKYFQRKPTAALEFGQLVHLMVFQPVQVFDSFAVIPDVNLTTKDGKAKKADVESRNPGKTIIKQAEFNAAEKIANNVRNHPRIKKYLPVSKFETSIFWHTDSIQCKGRVDMYAQEYGLVVDLKTTERPTHASFSKTIWEYGYHYQLAWYRRGLLALGLPVNYCVLIAVEKSAPYGCIAYELDSDVLDIADKKIDVWLAKYKECLEKNSWPGYTQDVLVIGIPDWAEKLDQEGL